MLNQAVKEHCLIIRLKNLDDDFKKILLINPDFTIDELKLIINAIYGICIAIMVISLIYYTGLMF